MQGDIPVINLDGYQRLANLERELNRSSGAVATAVTAGIGLLLTGTGSVLLHGSRLEAGRDSEISAVALLAAGVVIVVAAIGLGHFYKLAHLLCLRCPHCSGVLVHYIADLEEVEQGRHWEKGIFLDGRRYSPPFLGDGPNHPWVRAMKGVWVCVSCRAYLDGSEPHERACTADELERLQQLRTP